MTLFCNLRIFLDSLQHSGSLNLRWIGKKSTYSQLLPWIARQLIISLKGRRSIRARQNHVLQWKWNTVVIMDIVKKHHANGFNDQHLITKVSMVSFTRRETYFVGEKGICENFVRLLSRKNDTGSRRPANNVRIQRQLRKPFRHSKSINIGHKSVVDNQPWIVACWLWCLCPFPTFVVGKILNRFQQLFGCRVLAWL